MHSILQKKIIHMRADRHTYRSNASELLFLFCSSLFKYFACKYNKIGSALCLIVIAYLDLFFLTLQLTWESFHKGK